MKYNTGDIFKAWADAAAGKSMPHWEEYKKGIGKKYSYYIDTEGDLADIFRNQWKMEWRKPTPEEEKKEWKENHINEIRNAGKKYVK